MQQLSGLAGVLSGVERKRRCECGREFTQRQLTERFVEIAEGYSTRAVALLRAQIPDFFVPVHCPSCERRDLGRQARMDESKQSSERPSFGDRDAA